MLFSVSVSVLKMSIMIFPDPEAVEVCVAVEVGLGRGARDNLEVSEGLLARHTCMEQHTGQAVEDRQNLAEDSFGGDVSEVVQVSGGRLMFGERSGQV